MLLIADPLQSMTMEEVASGEWDDRGLRPMVDAPNIGYATHPYWIRLAFRNDTDREVERLLVLWRGSKHAQQMQVVDARGTRQHALGPGSDAVSGDLRSRHAVTRLVIAPHGAASVTIRFDSRLSSVLDYRLLSASRLAELEWRDQWLYGSLLGFDLAISAFVLLLGLRTREPLYFWFVAAAIGAVTYVMVYEGLIGGLLQWKSLWFMRWSGTLFGVGGIVCFIEFNRRVLDTPATLPRLDRRLLRPLSWIGLGIMAGSAIWAWPFLPLGALWALTATFATGAAFLWGGMRGGQPIRGFSIAVLLFLGVTVVYSLQLLGALPDVAMVHALRLAALAVSLLLFSFAVSERVRLRQEAVHEAVRQSELRLQQTVEARTRELSEAKEHAEAALRDLQSTQGQLVAAEKLASLGQLVAGVAHEINTPLGVALTASSYLGEHTERIRARVQDAKLARSELLRFLADTDEAANMIGANLERAAHLVSSFKQVSVDRSTDDRRRFDLGGYLSDLVASLRPSWKRRPLQLEVECPPHLELDSYPGALGQIISNLIQNALVHAYEPDAQGTMRIEVTTPSTDDVSIAFSDDGRGIDAAHLGHVFEPFYTTRRGQGGTGLGLHITFNLVTQKLGGHIDVESSAGRGTRFTMRLPRRAKNGPGIMPGPTTETGNGGRIRDQVILDQLGRDQPGGDQP